MSKIFTSNSPWSLFHRLWSRIMVYGLSSMVLFSCVTQKQLSYLQDVALQNAENYALAENSAYKIRKNDVLYIRFNTLNQSINEELNAATTQNLVSMFSNETSVFINGFCVNDSGNVIIPRIGEVNLLNQTLDQAQRTIQEKTSENIKNVSVIVKPLSYKFTVLGEVLHPGTYKNYNSQLTIFEALSMAGDVTDYGNISSILIIRPEAGDTKTYRIDMRKKDILSSDSYYILPNDVIVVNPIKAKSFALNNVNIQTAFSTISLIILIFSLTIK